MNSQGLRLERLRPLVCCTVGCAMSAGASAGPTHLSDAWLTVETPPVLSDIEARHSLLVDHGRRRTPTGALQVRIMAPAETLGDLAAEGWEVVQLPALRRQENGQYSTPAQGDELLRAAVEASSRAGITQLGSSVEGRPILGAWFGQPPQSGAPELRVLGAHHGDEWSSFEVALDLADRLATEDGLRPEVTALLDARTVWVVPFVNPDGVHYGARANARDVDLNRNYDFEWREQAFMSGASAFSEPETRAVRAHALSTVPALSLSLHSGATNLGFVWNYDTADTPEHETLEALALRYRQACTTPNFWVTNGADWYRSWGDTNDWSYGRYGGMDFTLELTLTKTPPASEIEAYVAEHREALLAFLATEIELSGTVVDALTQRPIPATLTGSGPGQTQPFLTDLNGNFARHAPIPGTRLAVSAPGYVATLVTEPSGAIALTPTSLSPALAHPARVSGGEWVTVEGLAPGTMSLTQPGHPSRVADAEAGGFRAPALEPGTWTIRDSEGHVYARALLVEGGGVAQRVDVTVDNGTLHLEGQDFGEGSRAWGLVGTERALVELAITEDAASSIRVDLAELDPASDVLVLTHGTWLVHTGRTEQTAPRDTAEEIPEDTGERPPMVADTATETVRAGCGCATGSNPQAIAGLLPLLLLRRRRS